MQAAIRQNFACDIFNYKETEAKKKTYPSISASAHLKSSHHILLNNPPGFWNWVKNNLAHSYFCIQMVVSINILDI